MTFMIEIEHNVPIPDRNYSKYPWALMDVGDSFVVPLSKREGVSTAANHQTRRNGCVYKVAKISAESVRVWRVK